MPDLLVHMTFALLIGVLFKIQNWKLLITGAILPDVSRIIITILNFLNFDEIKTLLYIEPIHTPFISLLLGLSISLLFEKRLNNFLVLALGIISHFFLDLLQFVGKFGAMLFYPFYLEEYALNLFYGGNVILPIIGGLVFIVCFFNLEKSELKFKRNVYFLIPLLLTFIILLSTPNKLIENNVKGSDFILHPEKYENKEVSLLISKVVSLNPVKLNEMNHEFELETSETLKLNSKISLYGIYKDKKIYVYSVFPHNYNKEIVSAIGLLVYLYLLIRK